MKSILIFSTILSISFSVLANTNIDCSNVAIRAAIREAKQYKPGTKISFGSISSINQSEKDPSVSKYEVNLLQWNNRDSFGLSYDVIVRVRNSKCLVLRTELVGEE